MKCQAVMVGLVTCICLAEETPSDVERVASEIMNGPLVRNAVERYATQLGIGPEAKFQDIVAGKPIPQYRLDISAIDEADEDPAVSGLLAEMGVWMVPLLVDGKAVCFFWVVEESGQWVYGGIGSSPIAKEWQRVCEAWPQQSGYNPELVFVDRLSSYYFHVPERGDHNLTPIVPALPSDGVAPAKPSYNEYRHIAASAAAILMVRKRQGSSLPSSRRRGAAAREAAPSPAEGAEPRQR
jgi:hypothetical protein